jgi:hypothetical protein
MTTSEPSTSGRATPTIPKANQLGTKRKHEASRFGQAQKEKQDQQRNALAQKRSSGDISVSPQIQAWLDREIRASREAAEASREIVEKLQLELKAQQTLTANLQTALAQTATKQPATLKQEPAEVELMETTDSTDDLDEPFETEKPKVKAEDTDVKPNVELKEEKVSIEQLDVKLTTYAGVTEQPTSSTKNDPQIPYRKKKIPPNKR